MHRAIGMGSAAFPDSLELEKVDGGVRRSLPPLQVGFGSTIPVEADNGLSNLTRGDVEKLRKLGGVSPTTALVSGLPLITMNRQVSAKETKHARHMRQSQ
jgi:hypothetical protein